MFTELLICSEFTIAQSSRFIGLASLGNLIGGSLFVAVLDYVRIRETGKYRPSALQSQ
jgi:formate/nitrite transporter FocA (FNT family)